MPRSHSLPLLTLLHCTTSHILTLFPLPHPFTSASLGERRIHSSRALQGLHDELAVHPDRVNETIFIAEEEFEGRIVDKTYGQVEVESMKAAAR